MREICIVGNSDYSVSLSSYKNSIARRVPYRNSYNIIFNAIKESGVSHISSLPVNRYFNTTQLKICKVS